MEFLFWSFVGLASLALASFIIVEGGFLIARIYSRSAYWLRYQYPSWRSARQVADLKRRYSHRGKSPRLGALRFTKSRAQAFTGTVIPKGTLKPGMTIRVRTMGRFGDGPPEA